MPFAYPATEVFNATGDRRVVWSNEEYGAALAEGWTDQRPVEPSVEMIQEVPRRGPGRPRKVVEPDEAA